MKIMYEISLKSAFDHDRVAQVASFFSLLFSFMALLQLAKIFRGKKIRLEVASKQTKLQSLQCEPFKASIERLLLPNFIFIGEFKDVALHGQYSKSTK